LSPSIAPQNPIRIVEPSSTSTATNLTAGNTTPGLFKPSGSISAVPQSGSNSSPTLNQWQNSSGAMGTTSNSPSASTRILDISELPPATAPTSTFPPPPVISLQPAVQSNGAAFSSSPMR
jgi:hypothetical protein